MQIETTLTKGGVKVSNADQSSSNHEINPGSTVALSSKLHALQALRTYTMVFALVVIWGIFQHVTQGAFLEARNLSNLLRQMSVTGTLAVAMVLVIVAAQIDLSIGSVVCFTGAVLGVLNTNMNYSPAAAFIITLAVGALIGLAQGYLTSYQKIPSFIVTLGGMMVFRGSSMWVTNNSTIPLQENWIKALGNAYISSSLGWILCGIALAVTAGYFIKNNISEKKHGLAGTSPVMMFLQLVALAALVLGAMKVMASYEGVPVPVLIMVAVMVIVHFMATRTTWGRHIYAIGGNADAAHLSGISVRGRILSVFVLMGVLSAVGGVITTARVGSASPDAGQLLELDAIAACVIGGTSLMGGIGSIPGAILGALVMESLNNGMSLADIEPFWQYIVKGLVLVLAVWADITSQRKSRAS
jgi:D-xylose transport system permease protein